MSNNDFLREDYERRRVSNADTAKKFKMLADAGFEAFLVSTYVVAVISVTLGLAYLLWTLAQKLL